MILLISYEKMEISPLIYTLQTLHLKQKKVNNGKEKGLKSIPTLLSADRYRPPHQVGGSHARTGPAPGLYRGHCVHCILQPRHDRPRTRSTQRSLCTLYTIATPGQAQHQVCTEVIVYITYYSHARTGPAPGLHRGNCEHCILQPCHDRPSIIVYYVYNSHALVDPAPGLHRGHCVHCILQPGHGRPSTRSTQRSLCTLYTIATTRQAQHQVCTEVIVYIVYYNHRHDRPSTRSAQRSLCTLCSPTCRDRPRTRFAKGLLCTVHSLLKPCQNWPSTRSAQRSQCTLYTMAMP